MMISIIFATHFQSCNCNQRSSRGIRQRHLGKPRNIGHKSYVILLPKPEALQPSPNTLFTIQTHHRPTDLLLWSRNGSEGQDSSQEFVQCQHDEVSQDADPLYVPSPSKESHLVTQSDKQFST
ncbi:hypothetical protein WA026_000494 [Henosepilachna vigintioctopunctata]|uniref:Uncharacterized protein n=1 Tax=Henosepilachna vigintioctopunctata TaxID=420089 RepID=A0AAW1V7S0_9CUCU